MANQSPTTCKALLLLPAVALMIAIPAFAHAQSGENLAQSGENLDQFDGLYDSDTPDSYNGSNAEKPKVSTNRIVLPEGYPISGRRAKLVTLPDDHRWFLVFDEAVKTLTPELLTKRPPNDHSLSKTAENAAKIDRNTLLANKKDSKMTKMGGAIPGEGENPFCRPIEVLPCSRLTAMIMYVGNRVDLSVDLLVKGEVTTYHNRNYILPTQVETSSLFGKDALKKTETPKKNPLDASFGPPKNQDAEITKQTQVADKSNSKIPKKLRDALASIPRTRPLELPDVKQIRSASQPAVAVPKSSGAKKSASPQTDWRDGYMVIDRVGRLHFDPEGLRWMFSFESDGTSLAEPPVTLHPCRLLEVMEHTAGRSADTLRFRVSGQISQYQGRNYMLLRKMLMVYDLGNLIQ